MEKYLVPLSNTNKVWVSIASIILITITVYEMFKLEYTETFNEREKSKPVEEIKMKVKVEPHYESFESREKHTLYQEGFQEGLVSLDDIKHQFEDIGDAIKNFFEFKRRFDKMSDGINELFNGIGQVLQNSGQAASIIGGDTGNLLTTIFECGVKTMKNIRICLPWYWLDMMLHMFKAVTITFPIFVIKELSGQDLTWIVNDIYDNILVPLDDIINASCSLTNAGSCHIIHFPQWVIDDCYYCSIQGPIDQINYDYNERIPELIGRPIDRINEGGNKIATFYNE